jgi:hypothetical protein
MSNEINGFQQQLEHQEKVQSMLENATNSIILDIKRHPPKRFLV